MEDGADSDEDRPAESKHRMEDRPGMMRRTNLQHPSRRRKLQKRAGEGRQGRGPIYLKLTLLATARRRLRVPKFVAFEQSPWDGQTPEGVRRARLF